MVILTTHDPDMLIKRLFEDIFFEQLKWLQSLQSLSYLQEV